jgi:acyl-CoA thioesterase YciA
MVTSSAAGCSAKWILAAESSHPRSRTVTVAVEAMNFRKPVFVGDVVSVHTNLVRIGKTSVTVHVEAWVIRRKEMHSILVTDGNFTYVSIDDNGRPQVIQHDEGAGDTK